MLRLFFLFWGLCFALAALAQHQFTFLNPENKLDKLHLAQSGNGTLFLGYRNKQNRETIFQVLDQHYQAATPATVALSEEVIALVPQFNGIDLYTLSEKEGINLKVTQLTAAGTSQSRQLLQFDKKQEDIVCYLSLDSLPTLITLNSSNQLLIRSFSGDKLLRTYEFAIDDAATASLLRKGATYFGDTTQIPFLFQAKANAKVFDEKGELVFVLDHQVKGFPITLVESFRLASGTHTSYRYTEPSRGYYECHSYLHGGYVYRLFNKNRDMLIQAYRLGSPEVLSTYSLDKKSLFTAAKPLYTEKRYLTDYIYLLPVANYKESAKSMMGEEAIWILPLAGGGFQLNVGSYYEDNSGIVPGTMGMLGIFLFFATTTVRSIHESGRGIERYISLNFNDHKLNQLAGHEHKSTLNEIDEIYQQLLAKHRKLSYFDYYWLNGVQHVAYATEKEKKQILVAPFASFTTELKP